MKVHEITNEYYLETINFLTQIRNRPKMFLRVPTIENIIIFLDGYSDGLIGQLIKKAEEDEYVVYNTPTSLVREYLIDNYLIPNSKLSNGINPFYTMTMYFKNKYPDNNQRIEEFLDLCIKCCSNQIKRQY